MNDKIEQLLYDILGEYIPDLHSKPDEILVDHHTETVLIAKSSGMISGLDIVRKVIEIVDDTLVLKVINGTGSLVEEDDIIAIISGKTISINKIMPLIHTLLIKLSSISSAMAPYHQVLKNTAIKLYDTPVTTPLFHWFELHAMVQAGASIFAEEFPKILTINTDHFEVMGSVNNAVNQLLGMIDHYAMIAVYVHTFEEYQDAIESDCDMIVLHNMSQPILDQCLSLPVYDKQRIVQGTLSVDMVSELTRFEIDGIRPVIDPMPIRIDEIRHRLD